MMERKFTAKVAVGDETAASLKNATPARRKNLTGRTTTREVVEEMMRQATVVSDPSTSSVATRTVSGETDKMIMETVYSRLYLYPNHFYTWKTPI